MNTVFSRCRVLMRKKRVFLLAEVLCLIAGASAFFAVGPLAQASQGPKQLQATFVDLVTGISQTGPLGPGVSGMTIQLSKNFVLNKQNQWAWVYVTVPVSGKTAYFMGEAFFGNKNNPVVELAEIQPPSDPTDPALLAILNKHQLYSLIGLPPGA